MYLLSLDQALVLLLLGVLTGLAVGREVSWRWWKRGQNDD